MKSAFRAFPLLIATAAMLHGQTDKKTTPPAVKPENWPKMKDCATQAEKVKASKDGVLAEYEKSVRELIAVLSDAQLLSESVAAIRAGTKAVSKPITLTKAFVNHYSPKYG